MMKVAVEITGLTAAGLVEYAQGIHDSLKGNSNFPLPSPNLEDLQRSINELQHVNESSPLKGLNRTRKPQHHSERMIRRHLRNLSKYVEFASNGNERIIRTSGFGVKKRHFPFEANNHSITYGERLIDLNSDLQLQWDSV